MASGYDEHSEYQRAVAATGAALIEQCVEATEPLPDGATFVVADYGASTGKNSIASVRTAVDAVRSASPTRPVAVLHNDVPTNDWNMLFANVASDAHSYLHAAGPPVLPLASAISFFEPAAPAGSVHLGVSFSAAHWLREQPTVDVDGFYFCDATGDARTALATQADADWTAFLTSRAHDLAPGARLLVQDVGTEPGADGDAPRVTASGLLTAMHDVAVQMADAGELDPDAVARYVLPVYARTPAEAVAPIERAGSDLATAFTVIEARTDPVANPYLTAWKADGDAAAYGKAYAAFVRGFTESSLRENLFTPGAVGADPQQRLDEYFARLETRFAADPEADPFEDWTLTVVLERRR
jgi:cyclopropane-fatty-acyl-phospholipid synthase